MKSLEGKRRLYLIMSIVGLVIAATFTAAAVILVMKLQYVPGIVFAILSAYGYYSAPFFFFAYTDSRLIMRVVAAAREGGIDSSADMSEKLGIRESTAEKFIKKAKKCGYIA